MRNRLFQSAALLTLYLVGVKLWFTLNDVVPDLTVSTATACTLGGLMVALLPFRYRPITT